MTYIQPLLLLFLGITFWGLFRLRRNAKIGLPLLGVAGLFLITWPPIDWLVALPLTAWYPVRPIPAGNAEALVLLATDVRPASFDRTIGLPDREMYTRCAYAAWLRKNWKALPILTSGGGGAITGTNFAAHMRNLLIREGVPPEFIWTEERSNSTHENAVLSAEILRSRGIRTVALIVDAKSMMRAAAAFRKEGIAVLPVPTSSRDFGPLQQELIPEARSIQRNEITLHEALGLLWYRLRGWI